MRSKAEGEGMKIRLHCTYYDEKKDKVGEPGDVIEVPAEEGKRLLCGGSAELVEPLKKSERD